MYKILSLDGGGSWAILQLLTLKERFKNEIPELNGHAILKKFDMIIANSGGSIVLCALAENWTIDKALGLFDKKEIRESIFSKNSFKETFWPVTITKWFSFGPKYNTSKKYEAFRNLFPTAHKLSMEELPEFIGKPSLKLIASTYDALNNRAKFFRSYSPVGASKEFVPLTKAIHGSSNAPLQYFDFPAKIKASESGIYYYLWDGALGGFNNPVTAGIIEAFRLAVPLHNMAVVSLGNANKLMSQNEKENFYKNYNITLKERKNKLTFWRFKYQFRYFKQTVMNQAKTILFNPPDWSNYVGLMFLSKTSGDNTSDRFIRLSPLIHIDKNSNEESQDLLHKLNKLDMDLTKDEDIDLLKKCFEHWKKGTIKNQPIEFNVSRTNELTYLKGDKTFEAGMKRWINL